MHIIDIRIKRQELINQIREFEEICQAYCADMVLITDQGKNDQASKDQLWNIISSISSNATTSRVSIQIMVDTCEKTLEKAIDQGVVE